MVSNQQILPSVNYNIIQWPLNRPSFMLLFIFMICGLFGFSEQNSRADANATQTWLRWSYVEVIGINNVRSSSRNVWPLRNIYFFNWQWFNTLLRRFLFIFPLSQTIYLPYLSKSNTDGALLETWTAYPFRALCNLLMLVINVRGNRKCNQKLQETESAIKNGKSKNTEDT
jgi:hypothetical protein